MVNDPRLIPDTPDCENCGDEFLELYEEDYEGKHYMCPECNHKQFERTAEDPDFYRDDE
jgi:DNA-directed RNA polymerase subunit RPC12/RpoP